MKTLVGTFLVAVAMSTAAVAQQKRPAAPADPCAPIGKTSDGRLVYSLKCGAIPLAVAPAAAPTAAAAPPAPEEEEDKGGLFRNPFPSIIRPTNVQRIPGVGPAAAGP